MEQQYDPTLLESFPNPHPKQAPWVSFLCSEFTSLCPKTGQPDFAKIFVNYIPAGKMLESKAAKLYLGSFRNHGAFHEDCVGVILEDLKALLTPRYIEVIGEFHLRGGIAIWPYFNYSNNEEKYGRLRDRRTEGYVPGKYSSLSLRS